nr:unnamed protein product [Spirometra erinaceieuropaei]
MSHPKPQPSSWLPTTQGRLLLDLVSYLSILMGAFSPPLVSTSVLDSFLPKSTTNKPITVLNLFVFQCPKTIS